MKKIRYKKFNNKGSALILTIVIFLVVTIMSVCLFTSFTVSTNVDLSTYKREQAYAYAQTGLNMVYEYVEGKAGEPDGSTYVSGLNGKTIKGTVSGITYDDPSINGPSDYPEFQVEISSVASANILQFKSKASYQGTTATAVRYMYITTEQEEDDDDAIDSAGDYNIAGNITDLEGNAVGNLRGNNITVSGYAEYNSIYALGAFNHNNSGLIVKQDIVAHGNIYFSGTSTGNIQSVGSIKLSNASGYPKSVIAWGESDGSENFPFPGDYAVDISIDAIGSEDTADSSTVVLYSGKNATIGGGGGYGSIDLYGTVIVNGNLDIKSTGVFHVYGDLIVKGSITGGNSIVVDGLQYSNLDDDGFEGITGGYSVPTINAINKVLNYPREMPVTIFPDVCNSPAVHPQRTAASGWDSAYVESAAAFARRQSDYKEINLADESQRKVIGNGADDDGSIKPVIVYDGNGVKNIIIYMNQSGKYVNLDQLIAAVSPENTANLVVYIDASSEDLDICIDKDWSFKNRNWGFLDSQLIVNDGNGTHTVRLFLEKNTNLSFNSYESGVWYGSPQIMGTHIGSFSTLYEKIKNGQAIYSDTNRIDTSSTNYIPRMFIFSDGSKKADGSIDEATQPHIIVEGRAGSETEKNLGGMLRAYIYAPYADIDISSNGTSSPIIGKIEAGSIATAPNQQTAVYYSRPDSKVYSDAISGVYFPPNSTASGSDGSAIYSSKPSRSAADPDADYVSFWLN